MGGEHRPPCYDWPHCLPLQRVPDQRLLTKRTREPLVHSSEVCCNVAPSTILVAPFQRGCHFSATSTSQQTMSYHGFTCICAFVAMVPRSSGGITFHDHDH